VRPLALLLLLSVTLAGRGEAAVPFKGVLSVFGLGGSKKEKVEKPPAVDDTKRTLQERVMKPNWEKSFEPAKGSPVSSRTSVGDKKASTKEFGAKQFSAKEFSSRDFAGSKNAYLGKSKVTLPEAQTKGRGIIPKIDEKAPTKAMAVNEAYDAGKKMEVRTATAANRPFLAKGRSQDLFDREKGVPESSKQIGYGGELNTLSLEDIRQLLNKNK
jgi:hypothetical protein